MQTLKYIFVHGLSGWGSYDIAYERMPYWGMRGGDLITGLRSQGFAAFAASVSPTGSAWDRACELFAQISGTRTDYGKAHSTVMRHERFGRDYSGCPLIPDWGADTRLVLLGHSFGGATVRLFSELLAHGDEREREATPADQLSAFFEGGMAERIHSIVTLASPLNGTTAYDLFQDEDFDPMQIKVPLWSKGLAKMMSAGTKPRQDGRAESDYANFDMHIDNALKLNERITTLPDVYYFSVPCNSSVKQTDGTYTPDHAKTEPLFAMRSYQIGQYSGKTRGGFILDDKWRENDGLVNTFSARAPLNAPQTELDRENIRPGIRNIFPTYDGDHMALQGGLMRKHEIRGFYSDLLGLIESTFSS